MHLEDLGADFLTGAAMNAVGPDNMGDGMGHGWSGFRLNELVFSQSAG